MRATITELMHANLLEVFTERDAARRRATIEHINAGDIRWTDDDGVTIRPNGIRNTPNTSA